MKEKGLIIILFLIPLCFCLEADITCPDSVSYNEEFTCTVEVNDADSTYDLKIYIKGDNTGINRIYEDSEFRRADRYLKEFITENGEYEVKLLIHKEYSGEAIGEFKIRKSETEEIIINEDFDIQISNEDKGTEDEKDNEEDEEKDSKDENQEEKEKIVITAKTVAENVTKPAKKVINLNLQKETKEEQIIYKSKSEQIKDYMIYAFIAFLIIIIFVLLIERRW